MAPKCVRQAQATWRAVVSQKKVPNFKTLTGGVRRGLKVGTFFFDRCRALQSNAYRKAPNIVKCNKEAPSPDEHVSKMLAMVSLTLCRQERLGLGPRVGRPLLQYEPI